MKPDPAIFAFSTPQRVAVVGVSRTRWKFGNTVFRELLRRGYDAVPVSMSEVPIEGKRAFLSLSVIPDPPESVIVVVKPERVGRLVDEAVRTGVRRIWFQQGADFTEAAALAKAAGLDVVTGKCILMYAEPVGGIHAVHRYLSRLFSRLRGVS